MMTRAGDEVLIKRSGFPVDIETEPAPLQAQCRGESCGQGRRECSHPHLCLTDESLDRVTGAARMGGGMQEVSKPMPLDEAPRDSWNKAQIAISVLVIIACVLWEAGWLQ